MKPIGWIGPLVAYLEAIALKKDGPDRATLAHLRRSLSESHDRTLAKLGGLFVRVPEHDVPHAILLAGLYALTKGDCPQTDDVNFGRAFAKVAVAKDDSGSTEKRFIDLLDTDATELPHKLRYAMSLVANAYIGLDWCQLGRDLCAWSHADRYVQKHWARAYWATLTPADDDANDDETAATDVATPTH